METRRTLREAIVADEVQTIQQAQALSALQTCLECCVCEILHDRDLLPKRSFQALSHLLPGADEPIQVKLFESKSNGRSGTLLKWLTSAARYLEDGSLSALQFCVQPDSYKRQVILESYTFTFQYSDEVISNSPAAPGLQQATNQRLSRHKNADELEQTIAAIRRTCAAMSPLPKERYLTANIYLHQDSETDDSTTAFEKMKHEQMLWPATGEWARRTETLDAWLFDHYSMRLRISYTGTNKAIPLTPTPTFSWPQYKQEVAPDEDVDWSFLMNVATAAPPAQTRPSHDDSRSHNALLEPGIEVANALDHMALPATMTQGDTQAASFSMTQTVHESTRIRYRPDMLHHERSEHRARQAADLAREIGGKTESGHTILCVCAHSREEGDMVMCTTCHTWQHLHCYGYVGRHDPRRPEHHICYFCFVEPRNDKTLTGLIELSLERRAMFRALQYGIVSKTHFADALGMDPGISGPIFLKLKDKGFIVATTGSHKAGFKLGGNPGWVSPGGSAYEKMLDHYFDPTTLLKAYFYDSRTKPARLVKQLKVSALVALPAPVLPARDRKKRAAESPDASQPDEQAIVGAERESNSTTPSMQQLGENEHENVDKERRNPRAKRNKLELVKSVLQSMQSGDIVDATP